MFCGSQLSASRERCWLKASRQISGTEADKRDGSNCYLDLSRLIAPQHRDGDARPRNDRPLREPPTRPWFIEDLAGNKRRTLRVKLFQMSFNVLNLANSPFVSSDVNQLDRIV